MRSTVYIRKENQDAWEHIEDKSEWVNKMLQDAKASYKEANELMDALKIGKVQGWKDHEGTMHLVLTPKAQTAPGAPFFSKLWQKVK